MGATVPSQSRALMRIYYPGVLMIPLLLALMTLLSVMSSFGIIQAARVWGFWPVTLIAAGLEELYLWATKKTRRGTFALERRWGAARWARALWWGCCSSRAARCCLSIISRF